MAKKVIEDAEKQKLAVEKKIQILSSATSRA